MEPVDKILKEPHDSVQCSESTTTTNRRGFCALVRSSLVLLVGVEFDGNGRRCAAFIFDRKKPNDQPVIRSQVARFSLRLALLFLPKRCDLQSNPNIIRFQSFTLRLASKLSRSLRHFPLGFIRSHLLFWAMETQYSHGSPYATTQPLETQRPSTAVQGARSSPQTLPPFSSYNHLLSLTYQNEPDPQAPQVASLQLSTSLVDPYIAFSNNMQSTVPSYSSQPTYTHFQKPYMLPQPYCLQNPNTEGCRSYRPLGNNQGRLPAICPIPDYLRGISSPPPTQWSSLSSPFQLHITPHRSHPIHVVGFQGRRGNIPYEDRAATVIDHYSGDQNCAHVPIKDENGKYPCSYCAKTYLHAKHLKRHMLRRTTTHEASGVNES